MNKRPYTQPELETYKVIALEAMSAMSGDDNDLDIGDTGWGDF